MQSSPALLCTLSAEAAPCRSVYAEPIDRCSARPSFIQHDHHPTSPLPCRFSLPFSIHQPARPPNLSLRAHALPVADAGPAPILPLLLHSCPSAPAQ